ncbi:MAG: peptide-methionine (S)-S-oxide reductase MsrA [Bacilli bacterium]|nr:peptide-methionine (S)-S-oxide reductase MsrA [Bacilli bacterium]
MNKCYLAGGCFWCIADYLGSFNGVEEVTAGYSGGDEKEVKYEDVKAQKTHHRETIEVAYNDAISLEDILDIFLSYVDPFDKDGQFIDKGHSYTLALYYQNDEEKELYEQKVEDLTRKSGQKVYISIEPFKFFVRAEEHHQQYSKKNPEAFYQELVDSNRTCHLKIFKR